MKSPKYKRKQEPKSENKVLEFALNLKEVIDSYIIKEAENTKKIMGKDKI